MDGIALPPEAVPKEAAADEVGDATVFLVDADGRLAPVARANAHSAAAALAALLQGPRETESAIGLRTAIPVGTNLRTTTVRTGTARIDLAEDFTNIVGSEQILALAQLVYTATVVPGVERVELAIDGELINVTRADGSLAEGPVTRADYAAVGPP
jgi:spore germination protein GerM